MSCGGSLTGDRLVEVQDGPAHVGPGCEFDGIECGVARTAPHREQRFRGLGVGGMDDPLSFEELLEYRDLLR